MASMGQKLLVLNACVCMVVKGTVTIVQILWALRFICFAFLTFAC